MWQDGINLHSFDKAFTETKCNSSKSKKAIIFLPLCYWNPNPNHWEFPRRGFNPERNQHLLLPQLIIKYVFIHLAKMNFIGFRYWCLCFWCCWDENVPHNICSVLLRKLLADVNVLRQGWWIPRETINNIYGFNLRNSRLQIIVLINWKPCTEGWQVDSWSTGTCYSPRMISRTSPGEVDHPASRGGDQDQDQEDGDVGEDDHDDLRCPRLIVTTATIPLTVMDHYQPLQLVASFLFSPKLEW